MDLDALTLNLPALEEHFAVKQRKKKKKKKTGKASGSLPTKAEKEKIEQVTIVENSERY